MKKIFSPILIIVLLAFLLPSSRASAKEEVIWHRSDIGMDGGSIYALAIDPQTPSTLYAGTYGGGLFKSENAGASWNESNSGLTNLFIKTLAINRKFHRLYTRNIRGGVFKSENGGETWTPSNSGLTDRYTYDLAVDPQIPTTLYAGTLGSGVFKSTDGGESWSESNSGLTNHGIETIAIDPKHPRRSTQGQAMDCSRVRMEEPPGVQSAMDYQVS